MPTSSILSPADLGLPAKFSTWRPGQWECINAGASTPKRFAAYATPTGGGKSVSAISTAIINGGRAVYVTSSKGLQDQLIDDFSECGLSDIRGRQNFLCTKGYGATCSEGRMLDCKDNRCSYNSARGDFIESSLASTNYAYYLTSIIHSEGVGKVDLLILDECFPAGTLVDGRPIETIQVGDFVTAYNEKDGTLSKRRVSFKFTNTTESVIEVVFSDGSKIACTPNHPFLTKNGWKVAEELKGQWCLHVRNSGMPSVQRADSNECRSEIQVQKTGVVGTSGEVWTSNQCATLQRTNEETKPDVKPSHQRENEKLFKSDRVEACKKSGEWEGSYRASENTSGSSKHENGGSSPVGTPNKGTPDLLQIGYRGPGIEIGHRSGWEESQSSIQTGAGQEERFETTWLRVDSVTLHKSGYSERFEILCPNGTVYNLEVEEHHTYTANSTVVHNCHSAVQELSNAIEIKLPHRVYEFIYNLLDVTPPYNQVLSEWRTWAKFAYPKAVQYFDDLKSKGNYKYLGLADRFKTTLEQISIVPESWILDESNKLETVISPIWPTDYAEKYLFNNTPSVILSSATLVPKTLTLLGIKQEDSVFLTQDHTFNPRRCPVYVFPHSNVDFKMSEGDWQATIGRMDTIIDHRLDRKGIIHCVSYANQSKVLRDSAHRNIMIAPRNASEFPAAVEEFKHSPAPSILISPAATTGYDFPLQECEFTIILKIPFIDGRSPIMKTRSELDPEYLSYLTAQTLVQTCGRGMRGPSDQNENFIMDGHAKWFLKPQSIVNGKNRGGYRHLVPSWFMRQVQYPTSLPAPPPPLSSQ